MAMAGKCGMLIPQSVLGAWHEDFWKGRKGVDMPVGSPSILASLGIFQWLSSVVFHFYLLLRFSFILHLGLAYLFLLIFWLFFQ